ncbi:MAG: ATP-binding protein [Gammaproteobacteria bacterium]|nr:ATP-binding protein [Gammaproteobacteria bacterium]MBU1415896.1 ATP-binding protein [Gammaproteobacteria bacterium]
MYVARVRVVNFRSLADADVNLASYTALVGLNDSGKSNLLRALNLFFNGQTDLGQHLVFEKDFSQQAKIISKKAKEIQIEVEFSPPSNYADRDPIIWRKTYRSDAETPRTDEVYRKDGGEFAKGSRVEYWVRHLAFEYVPAIRGKHFFAILKRRLYTTLAETVAPKLTSASASFLSDLRKEVKKIESESQRLLQLKTEFSLPGDLGELFEVLDFDAADSHAKTALQYRGDGIQGRHIPLILKFLADQRKSTSAKGKPSSETIWGFEEPENNLELAKQIEVAEEFNDYSGSIQILVSTHSPAFYGVAKQADGIRVAVRNAGRTEFQETLSPGSIDEHLGLMPFVQPYLERAVSERQALVDELKALKADSLVSNRPALYVEGSSDRTVLAAVLGKLYPEYQFEILAKEGLGGGVNWVVGCCISRAAMTDLSERTAALFDDDVAGQDATKRIADYSKAISRPDRTKCFIVAKQSADDEVRIIKKSGITLSFNLEELYGCAAWNHAEKKGWLIARGNELIRDNASLLTFSKNLSDILDERVKDGHAKRLITHKVKNEKKGVFAKHVADSIQSGAQVPGSLAVLAKEINDYFR